VYLFVPRWSELSQLVVWRKALEQVIFSLSLSFGSVIIYGSYSDFKNKVTYTIHILYVFIVFKLRKELM